MSSKAADKPLHDAVSRKLHASRLGYFADPFIASFSQDETVVNSPLMNRGYWLRVRAFERAIEHFVELLNHHPSTSVASGGAAAAPTEGGPAATSRLLPSRPFQVISVGAGLDTLFLKWAQAAQHVALPQAPDVPGHGHHNPTPFSAGLASFFGSLHRFVEIDRESVTEHKKNVMSRHPDLMGPFLSTQSPLGGDVYRLVGFDLRGGRAGLTQRLAELRAADPNVFDSTLPTIVIAECVLVYLPKASSDDVLSALFSDWISPEVAPLVAFASYDAINPTSRFGQNMVANLQHIGIELLGINDLPTPKAHEERILSVFGGGSDASAAAGTVVRSAAKAWTMSSLYTQIHPLSVQALNKIEPIDDWDEWKLVHDHYSFVFAVKWSAAAASVAPATPITSLFPAFKFVPGTVGSLGRSGSLPNAA